MNGNTAENMTGKQLKTCGKQLKHDRKTVENMRKQLKT